MAGFSIPKWLALEEMKASAWVFTVLTFNPFEDQGQKSAEDNTGRMALLASVGVLLPPASSVVPVGLRAPMAAVVPLQGFEVPGRVDSVGPVAQSEAGR